MSIHFLFQALSSDRDCLAKLKHAVKEMHKTGNSKKNILLCLLFMQIFVSRLSLHIGWETGLILSRIVKYSWHQSLRKSREPRYFEFDVKSAQLLSVSSTAEFCWFLAKMVSISLIKMQQGSSVVKKFSILLHENWQWESSVRNEFTELATEST